MKQKNLDIWPCLVLKYGVEVVFLNERIRKLRKLLNLTQQELADKLKIGRGTLANYELGRNEPLDAVIYSICREFNVNERWLRFGEGDVFSPEPEDELDALAKKYGLGRRERIFAEKLLNLKPEAREAALSYLIDVVNAINAEEAAHADSPEESSIDEETLDRYKREARAEADEIYEEILQEKLAADATEAFGQSNGGMSA